MASRKAKWIILVASLLMGCVLVSAHKCESIDDCESRDDCDQPVDKLVERLLNYGHDLEPEVVEKMLQAHESQQDEIRGNSVKILIELCKPSLDNCSRDILLSAEYVGYDYFDRIPNLYNYITYKQKNLRRFCTENYHKLRENFIANMDAAEANSVRSFVAAIEKVGTPQRLPTDRPRDIIIDAYRKLLGDGANANQAEEAPRKFENTQANLGQFFNKLASMCSFEPKQEQKALSGDDLIIKDSSAESPTRFVAANMRYLCYLADYFRASTDYIQLTSINYLYDDDDDEQEWQEEEEEEEEEDYNEYEER